MKDAQKDFGIVRMQEPTTDMARTRQGSVRMPRISSQHSKGGSGAPILVRSAAAWRRRDAHACSRTTTGRGRCGAWMP